MRESERRGSEIRPQRSPQELGVSTFLVLMSGVRPSQLKTSSPLERITCLDILTFVYIKIISPSFFLGGFVSCQVPMQGWASAWSPWERLYCSGFKVLFHLYLLFKGPRQFSDMDADFMHFPWLSLKMLTINSWLIINQNNIERLFFLVQELLKHYANQTFM